jgi:elongation of very long chain fatty acids protein 4
VYLLAYPSYPKFISQILFYYMISLLGLFGHFYYSKHVSPKAIKAKAAEKKKQ